MTETILPVISVGEDRSRIEGKVREGLEVCWERRRDEARRGRERETHDALVSLKPREKLRNEEELG